MTRYGDLETRSAEALHATQVDARRDQRRHVIGPDLPYPKEITALADLARLPILRRPALVAW